MTESSARKVSSSNRFHLTLDVGSSTSVLTVVGYIEDPKGSDMWPTIVEVWGWDPISRDGAILPAMGLSRRRALETAIFNLLCMKQQTGKV